jgi:hypothetical protein
MTEKKKCSFDPKSYAGQPIGMFHCPDCGAMVLAGMEHPDYDDMADKYQEYLDHKYDEFNRYLKSHLEEEVYYTFNFFMESNESVKHRLMEIWLRCDINEEQKCMHCNIDIPGNLLYCSEVCEKSHEFEMAQEPKL